MSPAKVKNLKVQQRTGLLEFDLEAKEKTLSERESH